MNENFMTDTRKKESLNKKVLILIVAALAMQFVSLILALTSSKNNIFEIIKSILTLVPMVVFLLYLTVMRTTTKLVPIIFASVAIGPFIDIIERIAMSLEKFNVYDLMHIILYQLIVFAIVAVPSALGVQSSLKGLKNKTFIIITTVAYCTLHLYYFASDLYSTLFYAISISIFNHEYYFIPALTSLTNNIALLLLFAGLFLYCYNNTIPSLVSDDFSLSKKKQTTAYTPAVSMDSYEQSLLLLKEKFELGIITEEEYERKRRDIIDNL